MSAESEARELRAIFPDAVEIAEADPRTVDGALYPEEETAIRRAVDRRRRQFVAGRVCARRALARLGLPPVPLPPGPNRAPVWPRGIVGSITHTEEYCAVAVARVAEVRAIGLDAEPRIALEPRYWNRILTGGERKRLERYAADRRGEVAKLVFSIKECVYKCQFPLTEHWLGFHDVEVDVDLDDGLFTARMVGGCGAEFSAGKPLAGDFLLLPSRIVSAMALPPRPRDRLRHRA